MLTGDQVQHQERQHWQDHHLQGLFHTVLSRTMRSYPDSFIGDEHCGQGIVVDHRHESFSKHCKLYTHLAPLYIKQDAIIIKQSSRPSLVSA
jgi:hypothetical protein